MNKKEYYRIETSVKLEIVREKVRKMFIEVYSASKGKFIGYCKDDAFNGHSKQSTQIDLKGKIYGNEEKTIIELTISDCSPDYKAITNAIFIIILLLSLLIIVANGVTDVISYLIPVIFLGLGYLALWLMRSVVKSFKTELRIIAKEFAKDVEGRIINIS